MTYWKCVGRVRYEKARLRRWDRIRAVGKETLDEEHLADGTIPYDDTYNKSINKRGNRVQQAANI